MPTLFARLLGLTGPRAAHAAGAPLLTRLLGGRAPAAAKPAAWPAPSSHPPAARRRGNRPVAARYGPDYQSADTATWTFPPEALSSSNLASVAYDSPSEQLEVRFQGASRNNSGVYRYSGVPLAVYRGLMAAPSHGRYFHVMIRGRYSFTQI